MQISALKRPGARERKRSRQLARKPRARRVHRPAWLLEPPAGDWVPRGAGEGGGAERNAVPIYDFAQSRTISHRVLNMPLRTSSLRSLGGHCNVFAAESFMDELALAAGVDPLAFRLRHLRNGRARDVLQAAADMAGWAQREAIEGCGMGLAVTQYKNTGAYCAVVAAIEAGHTLRVRQLWIAVDVGRVVNPDGVINQIEGGAVQTVSWVTREQVQFDRTRILSNTWDGYPILKFSEVPQVEVELIDRPEQKSVGAGEATHGPVSAAIAFSVVSSRSLSSSPPPPMARPRAPALAPAGSPSRTRPIRGQKPRPMPRPGQRRSGLRSVPAMRFPPSGPVRR